MPSLNTLKVRCLSEVFIVILCSGRSYTDEILSQDDCGRKLFWHERSECTWPLCLSKDSDTSGVGAQLEAQSLLDGAPNLLSAC